MKRKIAILLSAMMVTSAMPLSASAAHLGPDGILGATSFSKADETIDANAKDYAGYTSVNELKERKSIIKVALKDDNRGDITEPVSFKIDLENGTFDENKKDLFQYRNINGIDYAKATTGASDLTKVYEQMYTGSASKKITSDKVNLFENADPEVKKMLEPLADAVNSLTEEDLKLVTNKNQDKFVEIPKIKAALEKFKEALEVDAFEKAPLNHIPYELIIDSPTSATVKVPSINLSDTDKKITLTGKKEKEFNGQPTFKFIYGADSELTDGDFTFENLKQGGTKQITGLKVTFSTQDKTGAKEIVLENPYIAIPLGAVVADGNGAVKAKITPDYTEKVAAGEYTLTRDIQGGSTALVFDEKNIKAFEDVVTLDSVVIKENSRNTIGKGSKKDTGTVTLRLNGGFEFVDTTKDAKNPLKVMLDSPVLSGKPEDILDSLKVDGNKITFDLHNLDTVADRTQPIGIALKNVQIKATSKNFGDVELSVSGDGIDSQTKKVAKRETLGFKLETLKDAMDIIAGRHYKNDTHNNMTEGDNQTVEVRFSESVPNTLLEQRALDFTLPEGVKIADVKIEEMKNFSNLGREDFEIVDNGRTLRLNRTNVNGSDYKVSGDRTKVLASFKMKFDLSVDPGFQGDVTLSVAGGGQSKDTTPSVVIAKAKTPFEVKTSTTKVDLGYQDYNTADITITEAKPGMFLADEMVELKLVAPYGTGEVGFSEAKFEVGGNELQVKEKDFKVGERDRARGVISFKIDKSSYKNPASVTLKNVKIGSTRSVPFGSYDLALGGKAVINNFASEDKGKLEYDKEVKLTDALTSGATAVGLHYQNNNEHYLVKDYVNVITETGTLNKTVKVSVGEKTVLIGDKAIDMDVAPYIQASSQSTMVPLRFVSVALGVDNNVANPDESNKISFDANTKTTTIYYGAGTSQKIIQFQAGSNIMTVDGTKIPMQFGVKAEIKDGRMFVPFRALGQALGVPVNWDANTRTAIYNETDARNTNMTTTAATESTTESTTAKESSTESTTAKESSTESTTAKK